MLGTTLRIGLAAVAVAGAALVGDARPVGAIAPGGFYGVTGPVTDVSIAGEKWLSALSANGRYIAFRTQPPGGQPMLTILDRQTGATAALSDAATYGHGVSFSADGRYVAYELYWFNGLRPSVRVLDQMTHMTYQSPIGGPNPPLYWEPEFALSGDGRDLAFSARAEDETGTPGPFAAYVWDRVSGKTEMVADGFGANLAPDPEISPATTAWSGVGAATFSVVAEGRPSGAPGNYALKAVTTSTGLVRWISDYRAIPVTPGATYAVSAWLRTQGGAGTRGTLSVNFWDAGGAYIPATVDAAQSLSGTRDWTQLALQVKAPANAVSLRVELRLTGSGTLWCDTIGVGREGSSPDADVHVGGISGDGRYVALESAATNLVAGDDNGASDVFLYDRSTKTLTRASAWMTSVGGIAADEPTISRDGRYLTYRVRDTWNVRVYRHDLQTGEKLLLPDLPPFGYPKVWTISPDGHVFAVADAVNSFSIADLETGTGIGGNAPATALALSDDGQVVAWLDAEDAPTFGDTNGVADVYVAEYGGGNRAPDSGFETDPGPYYSAVGAATFSWASDQAHTGSHSLKIVSTTYGLVRWISQYQAIPVKAGGLYDVSAWLSKEQATAGRLSVNFWDAAGTYIPATVDASPTVGTGWVKTELTGLRAPANAAYLRVEFRLDTPGTLWIDDVEVAGPTP